MSISLPDDTGIAEVRAIAKGACIYGFPLVDNYRVLHSLTMYELPASLLVANPINRYLLNSPMLPQFRRDADGGITLYIQHESPEADKEANWLPAPEGPFIMILRLYSPKPEALDGAWQRPFLQRS